MSKRLIMAVLAITVLSFSLVALAEDPATPKVPGMPENMPPMGPPPEIMALSSMVGTWDAAMELRMDPNAEFMPNPGVAVYSMVAGGAALQCDYSSNMMGMPFVGLGLTTYHRDLKQWTTTWIDNIGGHSSVYTGTKADGKLVMTGKDIMGGETWDTRLTESEPKDGKFDFQMEHSTDQGKTWAVYMKGTYTKRP